MYTHTNPNIIITIHKPLNHSNSFVSLIISMTYIEIKRCYIHSINLKPWTNQRSHSIGYANLNVSKSIQFQGNQAFTRFLAGMPSDNYEGEFLVWPLKATPLTAPPPAKQDEGPRKTPQSEIYMKAWENRCLFEEVAYS